MYQFRILGPLELQTDAGAVDLGGARQRTVLASLLLDAGRLVPAERLADVVWPDGPPGTARTQISICVSALRRIFDRAGLTGNLIRTCRPGYLLQIEPERVDHMVMEQLVRRARSMCPGDPAGAAALFREAVDLWRGAALADLRDGGLRPVAQRLDDRCLSLWEELYRLELVLGRGAEIADDLAALVARNPFRERLRAQLMTALDAAGRTTEALAVYQNGRRLLVDEVGLEPGPRLRAAHALVLRGSARASSQPRPASGRSTIRSRTA